VLIVEIFNKYKHATFTAFLKITRSSATAEGPRDALC